jgi:hypothetical protein
MACLVVGKVELHQENARARPDVDFIAHWQREIQL